MKKISARAATPSFPVHTYLPEEGCEMHHVIDECSIFHIASVDVHSFSELLSPRG